MPTERFYRLAKKKIETIRRAAIREFKRVPPDEVSINRIIKDAEISRGSFYTYFEDKQDLLKWLLDDSVKEFRGFYHQELEANGGDIWEVFDRVLDDTVFWTEREGLVELVGNMMKRDFFSEYFQKESEGECQRQEENRHDIEWLYRHTDVKCCFLTLEEFQNLMELHMAVLAVSLKEFFQNHASLEIIKPAYRRRMRLLQYGACPRPEQTEC